MAARRKDPVDQLSAICLAFPEVVNKPFGGHSAPAFRVNDKIFVHTSEDSTSFACKAPAGVQAALVASDPERFFVPAYVGSKGWVGVRLDVEQDWDEMAELAEDSYRMTAPKRLVKRLDGEP